MPIPLHNIVLVGIGGVGMSALARILVDIGYTNIIGIDASQSQITDTLIDQGIQVIIGHGKYTVHPHDVVIYSDINAIYE